jgi:hypothetical protein
MGVASRADVTGGIAPADRRQRLLAVAGLGALTAYLAAVDPSDGGVWPPCPSRVLLGLDCPGCGGLRGTHDLLRGDVVAAVDHNLLVPAILAVAGVALALWLLPLVGRPARRLAPPRWLATAAVAVVVAFTVLRNLPVPGLEWLGST